MISAVDAPRMLAAQAVQRMDFLSTLCTTPAGHVFMCPPPSLLSPLPDVFLPHMQEAEEIDKVVSIMYPLGEGDSSAPPVSDAAVALPAIVSV